MSRVKLPLGFTVLYIGAAFVVGPLIDRGSWIRIGITIAMLLAAASAAVLWAIYGLFWSRRPKRGVGSLVMAGLLCPVVVPFSIFGILQLVSGYRERKVASQLAHSHLTNVRDELLLGAKGHPIGVRVHYTVTFDEGLDDLRRAPFSQMHVGVPVRNLPILDRHVTPKVEGAYREAAYEFSDDFMPDFSPFPLREPAPCFRWSNEVERAAILESPPQHFEIVVDPFRYRDRTANAYTYHTLYEGAVQEGVKECR